MQLKLGQNVAEKKKVLEQKRIQKEKWKKEQEERERYSKENFRYGSTAVMRHNGEFFFWGDIAHCGRKNIFDNARKIKSLMEESRKTKGHMNYDDPPTFDSNFVWEREQKERKTICKDDLYKFVGHKIVVAELIGNEPIGHIYRDSFPNGGGFAQFREA